MGSGGYFLPDRTDPQTDSGPHLRDSEGGLSGLAAQPLGEEQVEPTGDPAAVPASGPPHDRLEHPRRSLERLQHPSALRSRAAATPEPGSTVVPRP